MSPKISVIIPAHNSGRLILETVHSVLAQTHTNLELLLIDDGSTDRTLEILSTVTDKRLKIFSYGNSGLAAARNRGISHASGEFLAFLDHDDLWTESKLEDQLNALRIHPEAGVAYSWTTYFCDLSRGERRYRHGMRVSLEGHVYSQLLLNNFIESGSNILVRKEAVESIGGFDARPICNEDWDYYLRLSEQWSFVPVKKFQILYRQVPRSMSSQVKTFEQGGLTLIQKSYRSVPKSLQALKSETLSNHYRYCSELYLNQTHQPGTSLEALRSLGLSIYHQPKTMLQRQVPTLLVKLCLKLLLTPAQFTELQLKKRQQWATQFPNGP